jgi:4-carboxymuconolactone decarboxylase
MSDRLAVLRPDELSEEQRQLYAEIAGGPRASGLQLFALTDADGGLNGPFNAMLFAPRLGRALQGLGSAVRYQTDLSDRVREISILVVATAWDSEFERYAHEPVGRAAGLTDAEIAALRTGAELPLADPKERAALAVTRALVSRADLDDDEFAAAREALGIPALVELSTLVGYYATLALQLRLFRVPTPQ